MYRRSLEGVSCIKDPQMVFYVLKKFLSRSCLFRKPSRALLCLEDTPKVFYVQKTLSRSSMFRRPSEGLLCLEDLQKIVYV